MSSIIINSWLIIDQSTINNKKYFLFLKLIEVFQDW